MGEKSQLEIKVKLLTQTNDGLSTDINELKRKNGELISSLENLKEQFENAKREQEPSLTSAAKKIENLKHQKSELKSLLRKSQSGLQNVESENKAIIFEKANYQSELQCLAEKFKELEVNDYKLKEKNRELQGSLDAMQTVVAKLQSDLDQNESQKTALQAKIDHQSLTNELEMLKKSNADLQEKVTNIPARNRPSQQSIQQGVLLSNSNVHSSARKFDAFKTSKKESDDKLKQSSLEINLLKCNFAKLEQQCKEYQAQISYLNRQLQAEKQKSLKVWLYIKESHQLRIEDLKSFEGTLEQFESQVDCLKSQFEEIKVQWK